jgi:sugar lactone lactonase YvrE
MRSAAARSRDVELVVDGLGFPDAPRWHHGELWVSDIMTKQVLKVAADGTLSVFADVARGANGIGFMPDDTVLLVSMEDCRLLRYAGTTCTASVDLSDVTSGYVNDLVVDGFGRAYASDTGGRRLGDGTVTLEPIRMPGHISMWQIGQEPRIAATGLQVPNGLVVTPDGKTLIVAETLGERVSAFTIADDGSLLDSRVFAHLPGEVPNGISVDVEGAVWIASHTGRYLRVADGGEILDTIEVPGGPDRRAVACMLGGHDGRQLFMCSADSIPSHQDILDNVQRTGRIDVVGVAVPGAGWP